MANRNDIFITLAIFYSLLFGLMGFVDTGATVEEGTYEEEGFFGWVLSNFQFADDLTGYIQNMLSTISGLPTILNIIILTPLSIMVIWVLVELTIWVIPGLGG